MRWVWVSLPYATYGIAVRAGRVVDAAPIAHWMIGKDEHYVAAWLRRKGARIVPLDTPCLVTKPTTEGTA